MARSVGVTINAIVVFIGSAFTLLCGAFLMLGALIRPSLNRAPGVPPHLGAMIFVEAIFAFGFAGWGIASGVGLLKTKEWARISMVVFSVILLFFTLPPALLMAVIQIPVPNDPNLPSNFATLMRVGISLFFGFFAAFGGLWLYFFNKRSVKAQFQGREVPAEMPAAPLPGQLPVAAPRTRPAARPLSITIIGWLLLVSSPLALLGMWYSHSMFPSTPIPICLFGSFVFGRSAILIMVAWMAVQAIAALGLLKLKNWGRLGTIALQCLGILNIVLLVGIPTNRARFQTVMDSAMASVNAGMPPPVPFVFPAWVMMAASLPFFVVILWFLVTRKQAFLSAPQQPVSLL